MYSSINDPVSPAPVPDPDPDRHIRNLVANIVIGVAFIAAGMMLFGVLAYGPH